MYQHVQSCRFQQSSTLFFCSSSLSSPFSFLPLLLLLASSASHADEVVLETEGDGDGETNRKPLLAPPLLLLLLLPCLLWVAGLAEGLLTVLLLLLDRPGGGWGLKMQVLGDQ